MATFPVLDADGVEVPVTNNPNGQQANAGSAPVTLSTEQDAKVDALVLAAEATQAAVEATLTVGLPTGASTAANQASILSELEDVNTNLTAPVAILPVQPMMAGGAALANLAFSEARINTSSAGDTALVSATSGQTTKVYSMIVQAGSTANVVQIKDGSTVLIEWALAANEGVVLDFRQYPWFTTTANTALNINLGGATSVQGRLYYIKGA